MEPVRALARAATAWLRGMTAEGHDHCALPRPLTEPQNRMVEPESWGHSDFPFGRGHGLFCLSNHARRSPKGAVGVAL
jgi:hypothetical protein